MSDKKRTTRVRLLAIADKLSATINPPETASVDDLLTYIERWIEVKVDPTETVSANDLPRSTVLFEVGTIMSRCITKLNPAYIVPEDIRIGELAARLETAVDYSTNTLKASENNLGRKLEEARTERELLRGIIIDAMRK